MSKVVIVIPCYNEEARLDFRAYALFLESHENYRLLFVDDGSEDGTAQTIQEWSKNLKSDRVYLLRLEKNFGKGEAVRRGFLFLESHFPDTEIAGFLDADGSLNIEESIEFVKRLDYYSSVWAILGSRVRLLGRDIGRTWKRHYLSRVFATIASLVLKISIYDTQCGAKFFRLKNCRNIFQSRFSSKWLFDLELILRLKREAERTEESKNLGDYVIEYPVQKWIAKGGSKVGYSVVFFSVFDLIRIWWMSRT